MSDYRYVFDNAFHQAEIDKMKYKPIKRGNVEIEIQEQFDVAGLSGYMSVRTFSSLKNVPVLKIDGEIWMSLTPMEIESHFMPIKLAQGRVGVGGLGLGYFTESILDKPQVKEVVVYELNQEVIDIYLEQFGHHDKLKIVKKSVHEVRNEAFDFFYNDIYKYYLDDRVFEDAKMLWKNNVIYRYHFWGIEAFLLTLITEEEYRDYAMSLSCAMDYAEFIQSFLLVEQEHHFVFINIPYSAKEVYQKFVEYDLSKIL